MPTRSCGSSPHRRAVARSLRRSSGGGTTDRAPGRRRGRSLASFDADDARDPVVARQPSLRIALENDRSAARVCANSPFGVSGERIAREMHDGLAQVLGYVSTKSQAVDRAAGGGPHGRRAGPAGRSWTIAARSVYVDVREAILGLRSPPARQPALGRLRSRSTRLRFSECVQDRQRGSKPRALRPGDWVLRAGRGGAGSFRIGAGGAHERSQACVGGAGSWCRSLRRGGDRLRGTGGRRRTRNGAGTPPPTDWPRHYGLKTIAGARRQMIGGRAAIRGGASRTARRGRAARPDA